MAEKVIGTMSKRELALFGILLFGFILSMMWQIFASAKREGNQWKI